MKEVMEVNSTILDEEKYSSCEGGGDPFLQQLHFVTVSRNGGSEIESFQADAKTA